MATHVYFFFVLWSRAHFCFKILLYTGWRQTCFKHDSLGSSEEVMYLSRDWGWEEASRVVMGAGASAGRGACTEALGTRPAAPQGRPAFPPLRPVQQLPAGVPSSILVPRSVRIALPPWKSLSGLSLDTKEQNKIQPSLSSCMFWSPSAFHVTSSASSSPREF